MVGLALLSSWIQVTAATNPEPTFTPTNESWNYDLKGTDWTDTDCIANSILQSPIILTTNTTSLVLAIQDWLSYGYAFLPGFKKTTVPASYYGFNNYAWTIYLENSGDMGEFSAAEPFGNSNQVQIQWTPTDLVFHQPAEHQVQYNLTDEVTYDLELQINCETPSDTEIVICRQRKSTLSIFFTLGNQDTVNSTFLSFVTDATDGKDIEIDMSLLLTHIAGSKDIIFGYYGGDNIPPCSNFRCFYTKWDPFYITEEQLNFFKNSEYGPNAREVNQSTKAQIQLKGKGLFSKWSNPHDIITN